MSKMATVGTSVVATMPSVKNIYDKLLMAVKKHRK